MNPLLVTGVWLVEHLSTSQCRHALCGDLLEQRRAGRSSSWLVRDMLAALGSAILQRACRVSMPVFFAASWSALYRGYARPQSAVLRFGVDGPAGYSLLEPIGHVILQIIPVVTFLWLGLVVFASVRRDVLRTVTVSRVTCAFSASHAALLLSVMLWPKNSSATLVPLLMQGIFYVGWVNLPVALSLLVAILCVLPRYSEPPRLLRRARTPYTNVRARSASSLTLTLLLCVSCFTLHAHAQQASEVEQCTLPEIHIQGQPVPCVPLQVRMEQLHVHGVSIAVVHNGDLEWARGYGQATDKAPVTVDTLFQAGSISKPLSAAAALSLLQQGKLSLDADVNVSLRFWKVPADPKFPAATVSLRELLTHTAGMTVHGFPGYAAGEQVPSLIQVLNGTPPANTPPIRLEQVPGTEWNYSGGGYTVLQQLLIDVSGEPFSKLLQSSVLTPIGMTHSTYDQPLPAAMQSHSATPYLINGDPVPGGAHTYPERAAAGLWTTPTDLARYILEVQGSLEGKANHVLSKQLTQEMLTPGKGKWGLGLEIGGSPEDPYFSHGGVNEGFESLLVAYTHIGDGAVVMTNAQGGSRRAEEIMRGIATAYHWNDFRQKELTLVTVPRAILARYVGTYSLSPGPSYVIALVAGRLYSSAPSGEKTELLPTSEATFLVKNADAEIHFKADCKGDVKELRILFGGQTFSIPRTR